MIAYKQQPRTFTPDEYLELERKSNYKSEYLNGQIVAMSGGSPEHSIIANNTGAELRAQLKGKPCVTFNSDMKVRASPAGLFTYPDVTVACGELHFHDARRDILTNPIVIVEALSSSTEAYDRDEKFLNYQSISSLQTYVLIAQHRAQVKQFVRLPDEKWMLSTVSGRDKTIYLASIDCTLALSEIYDRIAFPVVPDAISL